MISFNAKIYKTGINPCVDIPLEIIKCLEISKGFVKVKGKIDDIDFISTLVPFNNHCYRLYINGEIRKKINKDVGDKITIFIEKDFEPRIFEIPPELNIAMQNNEKAKIKFEKLTNSRKKDICLYVGSLKKHETKAKVINRLIEQLNKGK